MRVMTVTTAGADSDIQAAGDLLAEAGERLNSPWTVARVNARDGDSTLDAIRAQNADLCIVAVDEGMFVANPALAGASDFVVALVDGQRTQSPEVDGLVAACTGGGADFAFVICNASVEAIDTDLVLALVQHGTVAPGGLGTTMATSGAREDAVALLGYLAERVPETERYKREPSPFARTTPSERRNFRRWAIEWPVRVATPGGMRPVSMTDISGGGVGFRTELDLGPGESVDIEVAGLGTFASQIVRRSGNHVGARFQLSSQAAEKLAGDIQAAVDRRRREWFEARRRGKAPATASPAAASPARGSVIVLMNTKGGTGKSTLAVHLAIALLYDGHHVATVDIDREQATFGEFLENRRHRAEAGELAMPLAHLGGEAGDIAAVTRFIAEQAASGADVVVDTPGRDFKGLGELLRQADHVVIPVNDSFLDLSILQAASRAGGPKRLLVMVSEKLRAAPGSIWLVRNRLSPLYSRNKARIADSVAEIAETHGARVGNGLSERVIYRELYPEGLTVFDIGATTGRRLTMSHLSAKQEIRSLAQMLGRTQDGATAHAARVARAG